MQRETASQVTAYVEVHLTAPDATTANRLARLLVEEGLAACVQVLPGVTSVYRWAGEVQVDDEHLLLVKSTAERFEALRERLLAEHPYDAPEVIAVPVVAADARYAAWLEASTRSSGRTRASDGTEGGVDDRVEHHAGTDGSGAGPPRD